MFWPFGKKKGLGSSQPRCDDWPNFANGKRPLARWTSTDRTLRIFLIANPDGTFGSRSEYFSNDQYALCWMEYSGGASIYDSEDTAAREIHDAYPWTRDVVPVRLT